MSEGLKKRLKTFDILSKMKLKTPPTTGTKRNELFSKLHQLQHDKEAIEQIHDIIFWSKFSTEILTDKMERLNERFILLQIRAIDKEIIETAKQLKLI